MVDPNYSSAADDGHRRPDGATHAVPARKVLEEVLRQTLQRGNDDPLATDLAALRQVAAMYGGLPLEVDPVARALVLAVLKLHFSGLTLPEEGWQTVARNIAATLLDDPVSNERLHRLWRRLCEVSS